MFMWFQVGDTADLPNMAEEFPKCGNYVPSISYLNSSGIGTPDVSVIFVSVVTISFIRIGQ